MIAIYRSSQCLRNKFLFPPIKYNAISNTWQVLQGPKPSIPSPNKEEMQWNVNYLIHKWMGYVSPFDILWTIQVHQWDGGGGGDGNKNRTQGCEASVELALSGLCMCGVWTNTGPWTVCYCAVKKNYKPKSKYLKTFMATCLGMRSRHKSRSSLTDSELQLPY